MEGPITLRYDRKLVRSVVLAYWWRLVGPGYIVALVFSTGMLLAKVSDGARSWLIGLFGGLLLFGALFPLVGLTLYYRQAMLRLRKMKPPQVAITMSEERFGIESTISSSSVSWSAVSEVRCHPRFWLLFLTKSQFITIPLESFPEIARAYLLDRVKSAGGKVG
jgi:hypothetical protein